MTENRLPPITGIQLINLLSKDGWTEYRRSKHGVALRKKVSDRTLVTIIPNKNKSLPPGTLMAILGEKQTKIKKEGLLSLIKIYGL